MLSDEELWAVARKVIEQHGPEARRRAVERQRELLDAEDWPGAETWSNILTRIRLLEDRAAGPLQ